MPHGMISRHIGQSKLMVARVLLFDSISKLSSTGVFSATRTPPRTECVCLLSRFSGGYAAHWAVILRLNDDFPGTLFNVRS